MSEKFGLDWQAHEIKRMTTFVHIMNFEGEKAKKDSKKQQAPKFRKRV